jgi:hypothetical protein
MKVRFFEILNVVVGCVGIIRAGLIQRFFLRVFGANNDPICKEVIIFSVYVYLTEFIKVSGVFKVRHVPINPVLLKNIILKAYFSPFLECILAIQGSVFYAIIWLTNFAIVSPEL